MHDASAARGRGPIKVRVQWGRRWLISVSFQEGREGKAWSPLRGNESEVLAGAEPGRRLFFQILASIRIPIFLFFSVSSFPLRILHGVRERAAGVLSGKCGRWRASVCCSGDCRECQQECPSGSDWSFRVFSYWQRNFAKRNEFIVQLSFSLCHLCIWNVIKVPSYYANPICSLEMELISIFKGKDFHLIFIFVFLLYEYTHY